VKKNGQGVEPSSTIAVTIHPNCQPAQSVKGWVVKKRLEYSTLLLPAIHLVMRCRRPRTVRAANRERMKCRRASTLNGGHEPHPWYQESFDERISARKVRNG